MRRRLGEGRVLLVLSAGHGEHMQLLLALRANFTEAINGLLVLIDRRQQQRVVLLASQELVDDLLHVTVASARPNLLESLLKMPILVHFFLHFLHEELAIQLLDHIVLHQSLLVLIVVVLLGGLGNFKLSLVTVFSLLKSIVLVLDGLLQRHDTRLPGRLLVVNVVHQIVEASLALQLALHGLSVLLRLLLVDLQFTMERFGQRISP